jgi:poly(A) polymerase
MTHSPEKEVERLLLAILPGSPWAGIVKAVGGYVRDECLANLRGETHDPKDLDIVVGVPGGSEELTKYLHGVFPYGTHTPIWQLVFKGPVFVDDKKFLTEGAIIEFADAMQERFPDENSRQREALPGTLEEDVLRRDFTVNMLWKDLTTGEIEDPAGCSLTHLHEGVLTSHPQVSPEQMFSDDPLRMLRLFRFHAKYGWEIPRHMLRAVKKCSDRITIVSNERILEEMNKVLAYGKLYEFIKLLSAGGLLKHILPEIENMKGCTQGADHHADGDVYVHTLRVLRLAKKTPRAQLAALFHDVGKPLTKKVSEGGKISFHTHENKGSSKAHHRLVSLRFPSEIVKPVEALVGMHMHPHFTTPESSEKAVRKLMRNAGELLEDLLDLAEADERGCLPVKYNTDALRQRITKIQESNISLGVDITKPVLNGHEVMEALGVSRGLIVGKAIEFLRDKQDEILSSGASLGKEEAVSLLKEWYSLGVYQGDEPAKIILGNGHIHQDMLGVFSSLRTKLDALPNPTMATAITFDYDLPLPSGIYGPSAGDPPVTDDQVYWGCRGDRPFPSRLISKPCRDSYKVTVVYGPGKGDIKKKLYTIHAGPPSPREPGDSTLRGHPEEKKLSEEFWAVHALSWQSY